MSKKDGKGRKIETVEAQSEIRVKALGVEQFDGEAPEDEDEKRRIVEENVIDEVEPGEGS